MNDNRRQDGLSLLIDNGRLLLLLLLLLLAPATTLVPPPFDVNIPEIDSRYTLCMSLPPVVAVVQVAAVHAWLSMQDSVTSGIIFNCVIST